MKRIVLFISVLFCTTAFSQVKFDRKLNIPVTESGDTLEFPWAGGINFPFISTIKLNGDTLPDIFLFDHHNNRILTFTNTGNSSFDLAWNYSPEYALQFPPVNVWAFLYDYNCDGKADFFTLSSASMCSGIAAYKNVTTGSTLQWVMVDSCMHEQFATIIQNIFTSSVSLPHFNDVDSDGDMDIFGYNSVADGRILYHKNYSMEDYGVCDSLKFKLETICYGNFQLNIGGTNKVGCFHCPCRMKRPILENESDFENTFYRNISDAEPVYNPSEAARRDDTVSSTFALDLDNDNFKELLVGDIASQNSLMIHHGGIDMDAQDTLFPSYDTPALFNGFHYHSFFDADNDGKKDLIAMPYDNENKKGMWLYKNNGTNSAPIFKFIMNNFLQGEMIDVGEDAAPVLFDYDSDSLLDLVISKAIFDSINGTYGAGLYLYKNSGTSASPSFDFITDDFAGLTAIGLYSSPTYPAFGDLDGDGDKDMIVGLEDGVLHYYNNVAGAGNPASFTGPTANYMGIDVGKYATPQLYDLDHDGLLDIICGEQNGYLNYFENRGSVSSPLFNAAPDNDSLGCIYLNVPATPNGYTVPFFYDSLGSTRLLVSNCTGNIFQYDNIDGNLNGCFHLSGKVYDFPESNRNKFNITVSGGDLNGDSLTDIVIGQSTGGAEIRYQHNPLSGIAEYPVIKPTFEIFPNPVSNDMSIRFYHLDNNLSLLRVFNSLGELVIEKSLREVKVEIKTSSWASGMYLVQLVSGRFSISRKVVVKH